jgi:hypothetical protein
VATQNESPEQILQSHPIHPHSGLLPLAENIWYVAGSLPRSKIGRNMAVVRLPSGKLLIHSGIALNSAGQNALEELGEVSHIIIPSPIHRMDAKWYKARYPKAKLICPEAARTKVSAVVEVDSTCEATLPKLGIKIHTMPGVKPSELAYEIDTGDGACLLFCDALMNNDNLPGIEGKILWLVGSTGFFGMTGIGRLMLLKDKGAFRTWLKEMADRNDLHSIVVAHGDPIRTDVKERLKSAADRL